jgi:iron(III) transport system permease protein
VTRWRLTLITVLLFLIGLPLAMPFVDLARRPAAWSAWQDHARFAELAGNTLLLVGGTLALALPVGVAAAVLLYRSDLPLRGALQRLTLLTLFVPLPLFASAWQAMLGSGGLLPVAAWTTPEPDDPDLEPTGFAWKPWARGLGPAVIVHAAAGLPWVIWLVGHGLCWVERELEEDALLAAGPWRVFWRVTLPRCRASIFAAGLWVALQAATEITVPDMMQVRTFAEEVYVQFVRPESSAPDLVARALAISLPAFVGTAALVLWATASWERRLPPLAAVSAPLCLFRLGASRWAVLAGVLAPTVVLLGVPLASLVWKAGLAGSPPAWSMATTIHYLSAGFRSQGRMILESLALAAAAGTVAAGLALVSCWLATESRRLHTLLLVLMASAWALPAPLLGIGLKDAINVLVDGEQGTISAIGVSGPGPLQVGLYLGPSPLPVLWADVLRFFPFALAVLWPVVRLLPRDLRDTCRLDGASPGQELTRLVWPLTAPVVIRAALAVAVLALGELGASKLAETPGSPTLAHEIFNQMHYGVTNTVAALCLVLLLFVAVLGTGVAILGAVWPGGRSGRRSVE